MKVDLECVENIIRNRRSVYPKDFREGERISDEIIEKILEMAVWAPTHKLTQPWMFKVFKGQGVKAFFEKQADIYKKITPKEVVSQKKIDKYAVKAEKVSHVVAVIVKHDPSNKIPEVEEIVAASCALQNIYLSLNAFNIAGYLSTGDVCYTDDMSKFLELDKGDKCLGFFQLGVPVENIKPVNRKRISASDKTIWVE